MRKTLILTLLLTTFTQSTNLAATNIEKLQERKLAVERNLQLPVSFIGDKPERFSVTERLQHHKVPGFSIALINDGKIEWASGYGSIGDENATPVSSQTLFQAASIAKPLTAYTVMRMQDAGDLNINADVQNYLKDFKLPQGKQTTDNPVTLKHLLAHTAGITGGGYSGYEKDKPIPTDEQTVTGIKPSQNPKAMVEQIPGTQVRYSGAGYTLVEIALQKHYQQSFTNIMDKWVLAETGMTQSTFNQSLSEAQQKQVARGYDYKNEMVAGGWRIHPEQAAAGLWSTPTDLAKFMIEMRNAYLGNSKNLSQDSAKKLLTPVFKDKDLSGSFGGQPAITFIVDGEGDTFKFQHGGANLGYRAFMVMYPESGDGAVFMANSDLGFSVGMEMLRAASQVYNWPGYKARMLERSSVNKKQQAQFKGDYQFDSGWQAKIIESKQASGIAIEFPNGDIYPLTAIVGDNKYVHQETGVSARFSVEQGKSQLHLYNQIGLKK